MKAIFVILLVLWIFLSVFDVFYNSAKAFSEFKEWGYLSDSQKRHKIFGDFYDFLILIQDHTNANDHILIYSDDVKTHYLGIYYLYPRVFVDTNNKNIFLKETKGGKYNYIAEYDHRISVSGYTKIASMSAKDFSHYGFLYKKE